MELHPHRSATAAPRAAGRRTGALAVAVALSVITAAIVSSPATAEPGPNSAPDSLTRLYAASPTPAMAWNSWYGHGAAISEAVIKQETQALIDTGLTEAGYKTVWLDDGWWGGSRERNGDFVIDAQKWPSGMKGLADYIHSKGLKAGIYTDSGYDGCGGADKGSAGYVQHDIDTFAAWGYDAVKIDHCGGDIKGLTEQQTYAAYRHAILNNSSGRPMVFNICRWQFQPYMPVTGNTWRTDFDVASVYTDGSYTPGSGQFSWAKIVRNLDSNARTPQVAGPGHFNDPDYLLTGHPLDTVPAASLDAAGRSQYSMWAMMAAPLVIGTSPSTLSDASLETLKNSEMIAVDQDPLGAQGVKVAEPANGLQVFSKRLSEPGTRAVALFNRTTTDAEMTVDFADTGLTGTIGLRDLWQHATLTPVTGTYTVKVPAYSTVVLKATGTEANRWDDTEGLQSSSPALATGGPDSADVFVRGTDGALYQKSWNGAAWSRNWT
ncbi:glycoside hydrolase family 27 protein, partial [Streptomyces sp. BE133]|uniref:glycoside hydrolase family 27 protein n=1 Tax=Streptomyces sp. BE133 TaxID=3002523 RepID=UPI002E78CF87